MPSTLSARSEDTVAAILNSASTLFVLRNYADVSMDDIAEASGVTKGALYHHFPNKLQLGYAVVEEAVGPWIREHWVAPLEQASNPIDGLTGHGSGRRITNREENSNVHIH